MSDSVCYIAGAGEYAEGFDCAGCFVIAADGGFAELLRRGLYPDMVVGDFDSLDFVPEHSCVIRHPAQKDDTDMALAVSEALERGYGTLVINGGLGGRLDHTIANISLLAHIAKRGARGYLCGQRENITVLRNSYIDFLPDANGYISVFARGGAAHGVTLEGLKYPLCEAVLYPDRALGVSNEFCGRPARVSAADGELVVIWSGTLDSTVKMW